MLAGRRLANVVDQQESTLRPTDQVDQVSHKQASIFDVVLPAAVNGALQSDQSTRLQREQVIAWSGARGAYEALHRDWVSVAESVDFTEDDVD
jgi:hypothetical protein